MMNKKVKYIVSILLAISLISFNAISSVVSDSDGSAFVTKAEFEALKQGFASQVENYNSSIDGKIDGAIASYLAGISLTRTETAKANISFIKYPLKIINCIAAMKNLDTPINNQSTPFYSPGYSLYGFIHRGVNENGRTGICLLEIPASRLWQKWLNGEWNSSSNKFLVSGYSDGLDYVFSGASYHDGDHQVTDLEAFFLSLDYSAAVSEVSNRTSGSARANGSNTLLSDYANFTNTDGLLKCVYSPGIFAGVSGATTSCRFSYGATDSLDTWKFTGASSIWFNRVKCSDKLKSKTYSPTKYDYIDEIYNCGLYYDSSVTEYNNTYYKIYLAPVTMGSNQTIYLTNLKKYRQVRNNSDTTKSGWWNSYTRQTTTGFTYTGVFTTGYNIESEYSTSPKTGTNAHPVTQRSAVKTNDLYYNFNDAKGGSIQHHMVDGIPIFSFEKTYAEKIEKAIVNFNISSYDATNKKYVIFSTKPITTQVYSKDVEANVDYIKIKKVNGAITDVRKAELSEGSNSIELEEDVLKGGDVLYMKILYDDASEGYITISQPELSIQAYS